MRRKTRAPRGRTERRDAARTRDKLGDARERLLTLEDGGSPGRPREVASPAVVEIHALSVLCPRCDGAHELVEHSAVTVEGRRLREARLRCRQCGSRRSLWFRLVSERIN